MGMHLTRSDSALVRKFILLRQQLNLYLKHFPSHEKFALTNRIRNTADTVYEHIITGSMQYHKKTTLTKLNESHELLRAYVYEAYMLDYFNWHDPRTRVSADDRYLCLSKMIDEVGKLIGAWIKKEQLKTKDCTRLVLCFSQTIYMPNLFLINYHYGVKNYVSIYSIHTNTKRVYNLAIC